MREKLSLAPTAVLRSEPQYYDTFAVFDCKRVTTEHLTAEQFMILECLSRKPADIEEISGRLLIGHRKCERFIRRMIDLGYVHPVAAVDDSRLPESVKVDPELFRRFKVPFLSAPTSVDVFITNRCNLHCIHCFANGEIDNAQELSFGHLKSIFDQLEQMRVLEVRINGGEPLLHPEIREIFDDMVQRRFRKVMLTNGTMLDEETTLLLNKCGITPTISLDDSLAEGHDRFRGVKGSFEKTVEALRILQKHDIQYGINCCLHKYNISRCEDIVNLATKHGACRIAFLDLKPVGRMKNNQVWVPSYIQYEDVLKQLDAARLRHKDIDVSSDVFMHCFPMRESILEARRGFVSCCAGKTRIVIDSSGLVYPCNLVLSDPQWVMGDTAKEKLSDIWFSEKWSFFRGKVKIEDLTKCMRCRNLKRCDDFYCRLLPYAANGDLFGPHPKCRTEGR